MKLASQTKTVSGYKLVSYRANEYYLGEIKIIKTSLLNRTAWEISKDKTNGLSDYFTTLEDAVNFAARKVGA